MHESKICVYKFFHPGTNFLIRTFLKYVPGLLLCNVYTSGKVNVNPRSTLQIAPNILIIFYSARMFVEFTGIFLKILEFLSIFWKPFIEIFFRFSGIFLGRFSSIFYNYLLKFLWNIFDTYFLLIDHFFSQILQNYLL